MWLLQQFESKNSMLSINMDRLFSKHYFIHIIVHTKIQGEIANIRNIFIITPLNW